MPPKLRHQCERCGLIAELERAGRFRDEDFYELLQDYFALECQFAAHIRLMQMRLECARSRIDQLRELVNQLPDPLPPDVEFVDEEEPECPF